MASQKLELLSCFAHCLTYRGDSRVWPRGAAQSTRGTNSFSSSLCPHHKPSVTSPGINRFKAVWSTVGQKGGPCFGYPPSSGDFWNYRHSAAMSELGSGDQAQPGLLKMASIPRTPELASEEPSSYRITRRAKPQKGSLQALTFSNTCLLLG